MDVLSTLKKTIFFSNKANSEFAQKEMNFLGHVLTWEGVRPNLRKLEVIKCWQRTIMVKTIKSFLGITNFYKKLIKGFSHIVCHFIDFLKKNCPLIGKKTNNLFLMIWRITLILIYVEVFELHKTIWSPYRCKWLYNQWCLDARWSPNYFLKQEVLKKSNWNGQFTKMNCTLLLVVWIIWQ